MVQRKWEGGWRERQSLFLTVYNQCEEKKLCSLQAHGDFKKDNEEALLIFLNVVHNGKDRMGEALLKGTVLKPRNNKSRQTLLFAVLASRLMFWRWDYLECGRTWLVSIDPLEKGEPTEKWRDRTLRHRIPYRSSSHLPWIQDEMCKLCSNNLYTAFGLRDTERSLVREGLFLLWVEKYEIARHMLHIIPGHWFDFSMEFSILVMLLNWKSWRQLREYSWR